ncbi:MAG: hypothetical protein EOP82_04915 [Variovorax sp.]|nr:MAG: hypothetical protein EOP82_04915 [Variovorax sp.]
MKLNAAINGILEQPDVKQPFAALGAVGIGGPPEKLRDDLGAEIAQWEELVKMRGWSLMEFVIIFIRIDAAKP